MSEADESMYAEAQTDLVPAQPAALLTSSVDRLMSTAAWVSFTTDPLAQDKEQL